MLLQTALRTIDIAPTIAYIMGIPEPQQSQGVVRLDLLKGGDARTLVPVIGLTDFHGQLEQTSYTMDGTECERWAARLSWQPCSTRKLHSCLRISFLFASGDNVGASPANSGLLQDKPAIDVENAWGLDATSYGNHEFDYGIAASAWTTRPALTSPSWARTSWMQTPCKNPTWVKGTHVFRLWQLKIGVIGIELKETPELVSAGATAGLEVPG